MEKSNKVARKGLNQSRGGGFALGLGTLLPLIRMEGEEDAYSHLWQVCKSHQAIVQRK